MQGGTNYIGLQKEVSLVLRQACVARSFVVWIRNEHRTQQGQPTLVFPLGGAGESQHNVQQGQRNGSPLLAAAE